MTVHAAGPVGCIQSTCLILITVFRQGAGPVGVMKVQVLSVNVIMYTNHNYLA